MQISFLHSQSVLLCSMFLSIGCNVSQPGSDDAAKAFVDSEVQQWMTGDLALGTKFKYDAKVIKPPIDYEIRSILPDEPNFFATSGDESLGDDYKEFPAYQISIVFHWQSEAGTPMKTVGSYNLTWNTLEQKWFLREEI